MSSLEGKVGSTRLRWLKPPRSEDGVGAVEVDGRVVEIAWKRKEGQIRIEFPDGVSEYWISASSSADDERSRWIVREAGTGKQWQGLGFLRAFDEQAATGARAKKGGMKVKAQMPGKVVKLLFQEGDAVEKGVPVLVLEAMKMENEIRAPSAGRISKLSLSVGSVVESGAELFVVEGGA